MGAHQERPELYRVTHNNRTAVVEPQPWGGRRGRYMRFEVSLFEGDNLVGLDRFSSAGLAEAVADEWVGQVRPDQTQPTSKEVEH